MSLDWKYLDVTRNWLKGVQMSLDKIQQLVGDLAQAMNANEKIAAPILAAKLARAASAYPQDKTIGMVARVMQEKATKNLFIRKSELKTLYNQYHTFGTKFAELFQDELGEAPAEPTVTTYQRDEGVKANAYEVGDQVLANALESVFDKHLPLKMYSQPVAHKALKSVGTTLDAWNLRPTDLSVGDGNEKFIVIKADYETPKGITSFYVPVEVAKNEVVDPEVFMGNTGPEDLNHTTIKAYLTQQAGTKSKIGATDILAALTAATSAKREVSAAELALTKLNATRQGKSEFAGSPDLWLGMKVEAAAKPDVELPKSDEFFSFEKEFTSPKGLASWRFGADQVAAARTHIVRELNSFGFARPQVVVTGNDENTIHFGVSLDTGKVAFTVPVKVANKKIHKPTFLLCNGSLASFDKEGINSLVSENKLDVKVAAVASTMSALKPSEVIANLQQAMADGNHAKAEDALNVLANCGDQRAYETGFQVYMDSLSGKTATVTKCSKMIKSAVSEYPVCTHTGLPINKVYQDKDGNCRPLYRKGMDETYEGAGAFLNAKIFG
jgi:hypothetical protein